MANRKSHRVILMTLVRHTTASLSLSESIIHFALVKYITKLPFLPIRRIDAMTQRTSISQKHVEDLGSHIQSFISRHISILSQILSREYQQFVKDGLTTISEEDYRVADLVDMVLRAAFNENLIVACGYCCDNKGPFLDIMLTFCYGCYPSLKDEEDDERWEVIDRVAKPRFIHNVKSQFRFVDASSSTGELILVKNTMYDHGVGVYLAGTWINNLPTMHTGVCDISYVARNAVVENSNGNSEGLFKNTKHDATYKAACNDPSTYLHHQYMHSRMNCAKMIDQLKDLQQRVDEYVKMTRLSANWFLRKRSCQALGTTKIVLNQRQQMEGRLLVLIYQVKSLPGAVAIA